VVQSSGEDRYREDQTASGSIIAMDRLDIPMDVTVIGENLIEEMGLYNADEIGEVVASVSSNESVNTSGGGGNTVYTLRGFRSVPRRNGFAPGGRLYDMTSVARIEVIKGPNSVLYGQTDPGGIINYIPKRPLFKQRTNLSAAYGTYDSYRLMADITGPIGDNKKMAYRVPMSYREFGSDIDFYNNERWVIAPSLLWRIGKKTELFIETELLRQEVNLADNVAWEMQDENNNWVTDYHKAGLGRSFNERGPNTYSINRQKNITAELTTRIGDNLHLRAQTSYNERDSEIRNVEPGNLRNRAILRGGNYPAFVSFPGNRVKGVKLDALYEADFGGIRSKTLLGFERNFNEFRVTRYNSNPNRLDPLPNPLDGETLTVDDWEWTLGDPRVNPDDWTIRNGHPTFNNAIWHNYRLTETLYMMDDRLVFLGGIARSDVRRLVKGVQTNPTERDTTYMIGLTYKVNEKVALFTNTSTSFVPVYRTDQNDLPLDPASGKGMEAGFKFTLFDNKLFATLTYFDLTNNGLPRQIPASESETGESYWVNSGEEEAKGVELELQWNVTPQFEVYFTYMNFDGKLVSKAQASAAGEPGADIPRSPEKSGQITLKYRFAKDSSLKGLRFGLTGTYKDAAPIKTNYTAPTIMSDEYFVLNGFIRYKLPTDLDTDLFLNFRNLLDKEYILPNNNYGNLRSVMAGVQVKF
jgi:iron complex outermembrane receptor protein